MEESSAFAAEWEEGSPLAPPSAGSSPARTVVDTAGQRGEGTRPGFSATQEPPKPAPAPQSIAPASSSSTATTPNRVGSKSVKTPGKGGDMDADEQLFVNEFGFEISTEEMKREEVYVKNIDGSKVIRREVKWSNMAADWTASASKMSDKIKERCRKGIPSKLRGIAWQLLLGSRREMQDPANVGVYDALKKKRMDTEVQGIIERDLARTFPTHVLFRDADGIGQTQLRNILRAYANIDPEVGYVQGMGFIVGTLMTQMDEEESFWALHSMMHTEKYRLRDMFKPGFPMLQLFFFQLKKLMADHVPKLFKRFEEIGVDPSFFASQWFLTLFVYHFQFRALLRVWDIFFCEGWKEVFRVAIALMKWEEKELLEMPFDKVLPALKLLHENKNPDEILERSLKVKFKTDELLKWRVEYEAQLRSGAIR
jgi:TBC1 domain family member 10